LPKLLRVHMPNKVVMLATDSRSTRLVYSGLSKSFIIDKVIIEDKVPAKQFLKYRLKKLGILTVLGQLAFQIGVATPLSIFSKKRLQTILQEANNPEIAIPKDKIIRVPSVNDESTREILATLSPTVIIVNGTRIIGKKTLTIIKAPFINTHVGITPQYRGVHGGYWALTENDPEGCGVTVHLVDTGVDTGAILGQALIKPTTKDNFTTYPVLQTLEAIEILRTIVPKALKGQIEPVESRSKRGSKQWFHPTILQYFKFRFLKGIK
jgi:folate-dependent phosphoribosylglycinamide formyltransferase PurN